MNQEEMSKILNDDSLSAEEKVAKINEALADVEFDHQQTEESYNDQQSQEISGNTEIKSLLESEVWPEAVLEFQIADEDSEEDKSDRAEGIVDILVEEDLEGKKFLDFGCGEGHAVKYANNEASVSVGYDLVKSGKLEWDNTDGYLLTTDFLKVQEKGPYDIVLVYDVLDHAENMVEVLNKVGSVLKEDGKVYLRCHPWCGRHGGHLYRKINKAFVHLILDEKELQDLGYTSKEFNQKIKYPLAMYGNAINKSNLKQKRSDIEEQEVENFFKENRFVRDRLLSIWEKSDWEESCPEFQMKQCFVDYVLEKSK